MKKINPEIPLGLICRKGLGSTLQKLGVVDFFWEIEKGQKTTYKKVLFEIKKFDIQLLVSAHTSIRTTLFCAQTPAKKKTTFAKPWNYFVFDERISWPGSFPESIRLLSLLSRHSKELQGLFSQLPQAEYFIQKDRQGQLPPPPVWADPHQGWQTQDTSVLKKWDLDGHKWIALFPGSVWKTKMWRKEGFQEVGRALEKKGFKIVVMGGPEEKELGEEVSRGIPGALNLCGKTPLIESLQLLATAELVVGNDSSSSHMAALVGVPVVAIFGPTALTFGYRPWAGVSAVAELEDLDCRPCGPHGHRKCPLGHHNCMKKLDSSEVLRVIEATMTRHRALSR